MWLEERKQLCWFRDEFGNLVYYYEFSLKSDTEIEFNYFISLDTVYFNLFGVLIIPTDDNVLLMLEWPQYRGFSLS